MANLTPEHETYGTHAALPCPWCGKDIEDLADRGVHAGDALACDHCGRRVDIRDVYVTVVARRG